MKKVDISGDTEPYFYNSRDNLDFLSIGDMVVLKFGDKPFRVKKDYIGKEVKFKVNDVFKYNYGSREIVRLALVQSNKAENFKESDILIVESTIRIEILMDRLFPCNRRPFAGWRNKEVKVIRS